MNTAKDQRGNRVHEADQEEQKHDESDLLKEVLMPALIQGECEPIFIS